MTTSTSEGQHDLATEIGQAVRAARAEYGLDQQTVADLAGVSPRFLRSVEHGKPTVQLDHVLRVLDALGLALRLDRRRDA